MWAFLLLASVALQADVMREIDLEPGLRYQLFAVHDDTETQDTMVHVLRIDPTFFDLVLLNASNLDDGGLRSARAWAEEHDLLATVNASMYQQDHLTSVSLMTTRTHTNNSYVSKDKSVLAFDPQEEGVPRVKLLDRQCDTLEVWRPRYGTLIQSIRMISCKGKNVWSPQPRRSSIAAVGTTHSGEVLLIHMTTPQSTHDLINMLLELPLDLDRAMYLEGGTPAQLFIRHPGLELEAAGTWCSERAGDGERAFALPLPNVLGVVRR